jgi:hypothetical protein
MTETQEIIPILKNELAIELPATVSGEELKERLAGYINDLIQTDFTKLVSLLYRIDVSESRLKILLHENPGADAGKIIAGLIIERQLQKLRSRREYRNPGGPIDEEEKW